MSSSITLHDPWLGKLVWFFPRDNKGLPTGDSAFCGIVIDKVQEGWYLIVKDNEVHDAWVADMEIVEEWSEEVEGEDGSMETS